MTAYIYRPDHPEANENGMIEKDRESAAPQAWSKGTARILGAILSGRSAAPNVISDTMAPMRHPITQEVFDSKSRFREVTRAHGCIEVGNDKFSARKPVETSPLAQAIARTHDQLSQRR